MSPRERHHLEIAQALLRLARRAIDDAHALLAKSCAEDLLAPVIAAQSHWQRAQDRVDEQLREALQSTESTPP